MCRNSTTSAVCNAVSSIGGKEEPHAHRKGWVCCNHVVTVPTTSATPRRPGVSSCSERIWVRSAQCFDKDWRQQPLTDDFQVPLVHSGCETPSSSSARVLFCSTSPSSASSRGRFLSLSAASSIRQTRSGKHTLMRCTLSVGGVTIHSRPQELDQHLVPSLVGASAGVI